MSGACKILASCACETRNSQGKALERRAQTRSSATRPRAVFAPVKGTRMTGLLALGATDVRRGLGMRHWGRIAFGRARFGPTCSFENFVLVMASSYEPADGRLPGAGSAAKCGSNRQRTLVGATAHFTIRIVPRGRISFPICIKAHRLPARMPSIPRERLPH